VQGCSAPVQCRRPVLEDAEWFPAVSRLRGVIKQVSSFDGKPSALIVDNRVRGPVHRGGFGYRRYLEASHMTSQNNTNTSRPSPKPISTPSSLANIAST